MQVLGHSVVGASLEDAQFDEDIDSQPPPQAGATANRYEIIGTLGDPQAVKPDWVAEIIQSSSPDDLLGALLTCDVIVYHSEVHEETSWAVQGTVNHCLYSTTIMLCSSISTAIHDQLSTFASQKVFVLISTVMTWARSKPLDPVRHPHSDMPSVTSIASDTHAFTKCHACNSYA